MVRQQLCDFRQLRILAASDSLRLMGAACAFIGLWAEGWLSALSWECRWWGLRLILLMFVRHQDMIVNIGGELRWWPIGRVAGCVVPSRRFLLPA